MLTHISARNLACFGDQDNHVTLYPETVLIGPNNVGKSAMIAAFNAMHVALYSGLQWNWPSLYSWGDFATIVHRHDLQRVIQMRVEVRGHLWTGTLTTSIKQEGGISIIPEPREGDFRQELARIWYLRTSRSEIPSQQQVVGPNVPLLIPWNQPLYPDGSNVVTYLLERFTSQDPNWPTAQEWIRRIDPESSILKSPLRGVWASLETTQGVAGIDVNVAYQGTGIQKVLSVIAALVFSPKGSTIIIEEPESNLHPRSQEILVDLFNTAVNDWKKQVIFTTHSWNMVKPFINDLGDNIVSRRGTEHAKAKRENCKVIEFSRKGEGIQIDELSFVGKTFTQTQNHLKELWG